MEKAPYIAPTLDALAFRQERGYASSYGGGIPLEGHLELMDLERAGDSHRETEAFSTHNLWRQDNGESFWN